MHLLMQILYKLAMILYIHTLNVIVQQLYPKPLNDQLHIDLINCGRSAPERGNWLSTGANIILH